MKTFSAKTQDISRDWWVVDAKDLVLGRLSTIVASKLRGKDKPLYTPHVDCGDHVIVVNADQVHLSGNKRWQKTQYWHTGYPGGIKSITADKQLTGEHPERLVYNSVRRMLQKNTLADKQLKKLHVYAGSEHPHEAQKPKTLDIASMNTKNVKRA